MAHRISGEEGDLVHPVVVGFSQRGDDDDALGLALFTGLRHASHAHLTGMLQEFGGGTDVKKRVTKLRVISEERFTPRDVGPTAHVRLPGRVTAGNLPHAVAARTIAPPRPERRRHPTPPPPLPRRSRFTPPCSSLYMHFLFFKTFFSFSFSRPTKAFPPIARRGAGVIFFIFMVIFPRPHGELRTSEPRGTHLRRRWRRRTPDAPWAAFGVLWCISTCRLRSRTCTNAIASGHTRRTSAAALMARRCGARLSSLSATHVQTITRCAGLAFSSSAETTTCRWPLPRNNLLPRRLPASTVTARHLRLLLLLLNRQTYVVL